MDPIEGSNSGLPRISPVRSEVLAPPTGRWPVFPTFDRRTLAGLVRTELAERGERPESITERRTEHARGLLLCSTGMFGPVD